MTCPQRLRPIRFLMMAKTTFRESAFGLRFGFDDRVSILLNPPVSSRAHHFTIALCVYTQSVVPLSVSTIPLALLNEPHHAAPVEGLGSCCMPCTPYSQKG